MTKLYEEYFITNENLSHEDEATLKKYLSHAGILGTPFLSVSLAKNYGKSGFLGLIAGYVLLASYRSYKRVFDKCDRHCRTLLSANTIAVQLCKTQCRYSAELERFKVYKKSLDSCKVIKNKDKSQKCEKNIKEKLNLINKKLKNNKEKIIELKKLMDKKKYLEVEYRKDGKKGESTLHYYGW